MTQNGIIQNNGQALLSELTVNGTIYYQNLVPLSREELKENIKPIELNGLDIVNGTSLYSFNYKNSEDKNTKYGIVIGENYDAPREIIYTDENGEGRGVDLLNYISIVCKSVQELSAKVDELENQVKGLEKGDK